MLSPEQFRQIKAQLLKQIEQLPENQREALREQISGMDAEHLEQFLRQNGMLKEGEEEIGEETSHEAPGKQECVFCLILQGKVPSYKIDENKTSLAILEINPLSKAHSIVLSKEHDRLPSSAFTLANKIGKRIKSKFKPEEVKIENAKLLGHNLIQIIPIYKDQKLEKKKAEEKELILLQDKLKAKPRKKKEKPVIEQKPLEKVPRRIP